MSTSNLISLEEIISYMPGNVYWTDTDGVYRGCNSNLVKVLRQGSAEGVVGKKIHQLTNNTAIADLVSKIDSEVMANDKEVIVEEEAFDSEGRWACYFTKKLPLHDNDGRVVGLLGMSLDITERKLAEQAAIKAKEEAEAASRAKTDFLASMSHDVKTPLSGVIAIAELLTQRLQGADKKLVEDIQSCGKTLMTFFENCIELSKMDMLQLKDVNQPFSMAKITESIHALFVPSATAKKLFFGVSQDPKLPTILMGNQVNIYRVILNLVGNAIKFTTSGSVSLSVLLDQQIDDENIIIKIIVKDTGMGIPKDKQKVIFEKMQRLTPSYYNKQEGHGIGLYIVDQYVQAMQGTIDVDSDEGMGSTFTVTLPLKIASSNETDIIAPPKLSAQEVPAARVPEHHATPAYRASEQQNLKEDAPRVLLVEDTPLIQAVTKQILLGAGMRVDVASSGKEAIDAFISRKYLVVFMDIGLPDMNGYEASQHLRAIEAKNHAAATPILALTAHATVDIQTFCTGAGMNGVLNKPLSCKQAQQILEHYALKIPVTVEGLLLLEAVGFESAATLSPAASQLAIIDFPGCVKILETEASAKEMLTMVINLLDTLFIPEIQTAYDKNDEIELRKAIHKFLGSLCYISTPALKQATLDFQTAVKEVTTIRQQAFEAFLREVRQFKIAYRVLDSFHV